MANWRAAACGKSRRTTIPSRYALLDRVPAIDAGTNITTGDPPTDNLRYQKAQVLENGALVDLAVRELQAAGNRRQRELGDGRDRKTL